MKNKIILIIITIISLTIVGLLYAKSRSPIKPSPVQQSNCCGGQNFGAIEGHVYDPDGKLISGANVYAERTDALMSRALFGVSDENGKFLIEYLSPGRYIVYASKESDGYPITTSSFYYTEHITFPEIIVNERQVTSNVKVNLGAKVPKLILRITDAETNKPIRSAHIILQHADNPNYFYSSNVSPLGNEDLEILVPAIPFTMEISAPKYRVWHYKPPNSSSNSLQLERGEIKRLDIPMRPSR